MSTILIAALIMAESPVAVEPGSRASKKEPKQVCETIQVTGSRTRHRVCRDVNGELEMGPNVSHAGPNAGMLHASPPTAPTGFGAPPR